MALESHCVKPFGTSNSTVQHSIEYNSHHKPPLDHDNKNTLPNSKSPSSLTRDALDVHNSHVNPSLMSGITRMRHGQVNPPSTFTTSKTSTISKSYKSHFPHSIQNNIKDDDYHQRFNLNTVKTNDGLRNKDEKLTINIKNLASTSSCSQNYPNPPNSFDTQSSCFKSTRSSVAPTCTTEITALSPSSSLSSSSTSTFITNNNNNYNEYKNYENATSHTNDNKPQPVNILKGHSEDNYTQNKSKRPISTNGYAQNSNFNHLTKLIDSTMCTERNHKEQKEQKEHKEQKEQKEQKSKWLKPHASVADSILPTDSVSVVASHNKNL